jgi:hypothetical protein
MPELGDDRPAVLLILPPPPPAIVPGEQAPPPFGEQEIARVKQAIDNGTTAVFLAGYLWPMRIPVGPGQVSFVDTPYQYEDYLREEWGVYPMTDYLVISGLPDEDKPGELRLNYKWLTHMPLNLFTDHPIGKPLGGQKMLWASPCPVKIEQDVPGDVSARPLLCIPPGWGNFTWATPRVTELIRQTQHGPVTHIEAHYGLGNQSDIPIPQESPGLPLAVAATRRGGQASGEATGDETKQVMPVRMVVLGVGASMTNAALTTGPVRFDDKGSLRMEDPPRANADLVINSLYWVIGRDDFIASGPAQGKPIRTMTEGTRSALWITCVLVLPAVVCAAGGLVMVLRRR